MNKNLFFTFLFISFGWISVAQESAPNHIKSIVLKPLEDTNFKTIVPLGKVLRLSFDDLEADQKEYQYKIEHMTFDWKPSSILVSEYLDGFQQNTIQNYENSFNTLVNYTHYSVQFPNNTIRFKKSGNYQISVTDNNGTLIFKRRFTYFENSATIATKINRSRNTSNTHQTVNFTIHRHKKSTLQYFKTTTGKPQSPI